MFFGREDLILQLEGLWRKRVSSLVTCRGRRRIGKSTLIRQFAKATQSRFIKIEGARPETGTTREDELRVFAEQLAAQTGCEDTTPSNWLNAFIRLAGRIRERLSPYERQVFNFKRESVPSELGVFLDLLGRSAPGEGNCYAESDLPEEFFALLRGLDAVADLPKEQQLVFLRTRLSDLIVMVATTESRSGTAISERLGARVVSYIPAGGEEILAMLDSGTGGIPAAFPCGGSDLE